MKHIREIKVAVLAVVCIGLLYFGMYFLRGVNLFSPTHTYTGKFEQLNGLTEQAPVYVRGYQVGPVETIQFDFTRTEAFTVRIAIDRHIFLPQGSEMVLVADGLLGRKAVEVVIPFDQSTEAAADTLPTRIEGGLMETLQQGLLAHVDSVVLRLDSLLANVEGQLQGDHIAQTLQHVDQITSDLTVSARDIRHLTHRQIPQVVDSVSITIAHANAVLANVRQADLAGTVARVDSTFDRLQQAMQSDESTLGLLLRNPSLYNHLDSTVVSADSLLIDLKANPKRYVHFSLFGK